MADDGNKAKHGQKRGPRKATPKHLENAALHYLGRFATSAANLHRVLMRRVERSARFHGTDRDEGRDAVDALIARFETAGLLDDAAYARGRAESLHRRGNSRRMIRAKLRQKGVAADAVEEALDVLADGGSEEKTELAAAHAFARRRRLGPYKAGKAVVEEREKHLAALARAGFSYDVAKAVVDGGAEDPAADPPPDRGGR